LTLEFKMKLIHLILLIYIFISSFIVACGEKKDINQLALSENSQVQLVDNKTKEQIEKESEALKKLKEYEADRAQKLNNDQNQDSSIASNDVYFNSQQNNLKSFKNELAECSGNSLLIIASIKSQILTTGSDINNDKAIKFNGAMNMIYSEIGKSINGDDYDHVAQELYDSKIENFRNQKISLGVAQAKQNIINDMMAKSVSCSGLLQDPTNASYAASVIGAEKMKVTAEYIQKQIPSK